MTVGHLASLKMTTGISRVVADTWWAIPGRLSLSCWRANENYWAHGQPLLAPAAGTVVTAIDGLPDQVPLESIDVANPAGNHVVIEVAEGEYLLIAHMQPRSLAVAVGDVVESGQPIGLVGNSGNTSGPHIHIHLQDQPTFDPATATGLPLEFTNYLADGMSVEHGGPIADQFIGNG